MNLSHLIDDLIGEDDNATIRDYLDLVRDIQAIETQTRLIEIDKQLSEYESEYPTIKSKAIYIGLAARPVPDANTSIQPRLPERWRIVSYVH